MNKPPTPTPREMEILKVLWEQGPSSVRAVYEYLARSGKLAYNTAQTLLRIMEDKGLVEHHNKGRKFVYSPQFSRDESATRFLDRVFDGAADELVLSLLRSERISSGELEKMRHMIEAERDSRDGKGVGVIGGQI